MSREKVDLLSFNIHSGFKRTKENYTKQSLKGAGIGLLTLGMAIPTPFPHNSFIFTMVADKKKGKLVLVNYNATQINPLALNATYEQYCKLLHHVFTIYSYGECYHKQ